MQTLGRVQGELQSAVVLIGHDMGLMAQFADRVAVMRAGVIVEQNDVKALFARPTHPYTRLLMNSLPSLDQREPVPAPAGQATVIPSTATGAQPPRPASMEIRG
jgi:ABC-type dipeptide/oligopeptide/nickel transport system ATPase component